MKDDQAKLALDSIFESILKDRGLDKEQIIDQLKIEWVRQNGTPFVEDMPVIKPTNKMPTSLQMERWIFDIITTFCEINSTFQKSLLIEGALQRVIIMLRTSQVQKLLKRAFKIPDTPEQEEAVELEIRIPRWLHKIIENHNSSFGTNTNELIKIGLMKYIVINERRPKFFDQLWLGAMNDPFNTLKTIF